MLHFKFGRLGHLPYIKIYPVYEEIDSPAFSTYMWRRVDRNDEAPQWTVDLPVWRERGNAHFPRTPIPGECWISHRSQWAPRYRGPV